MKTDGNLLSRAAMKAMGMALLAYGAMTAPAQAADWPARSVELVIPQGAGGGTDVLGRLWAKHVEESIGKSVVVLNKPGANGLIASSYVAQKKPDGHTVLLTGVSYLSVNPHIYKSLGYDPEKDFKGIALLASTPFVLTASKASGIKTFDEFVKVAKAARQPMTFASAGKGNSTHLVMEMLRDRVGVDLLHVPYTGGRLALSVISGEVDFAANVMNSIQAAAKNGDAYALAVIGRSSRSENLPDVPTLDELGIKDFPLPGWYALVAPAGTPEDVIDQINAETQKFFKDPEVLTSLKAMDMDPLPGVPGMVEEWMKRDSVIWGDFIKAHDLQNN